MERAPVRLLPLAALLAGNVALAMGPWFVRLADTGPVSAGFWRVALALPFLALLARMHRQPLGGIPRPVVLAVLAGVLTVHGVEKPVEIDLKKVGEGADPWGGYRAGFVGTYTMTRKDFGIDIEMPLETGGTVVGDKITITLEIEAGLAQ